MEAYVDWVLKTADNQLSIAERHQAFGELVHLFQDMAYSIANSILDDFHLAQDAVQESFVVAYKQLPQLLDPHAFPGWFKKIVLSQCHRFIRGKQLPKNSLEITADLLSDEPDPALAVEDFELKDKVLTAIQALPEREQIITKLFYFNGYSQKEIAKLLQIPVTTVKKRLQYAREHLRGVMATMFEVATPTPAPVPIPIPHRRLPQYPDEF